MDFWNTVKELKKWGTTFERISKGDKKKFHMCYRI